jgi:hypothetical protein
MSLADDILREMEGTDTSSGTHAHVIGSSGLGKSRFLEHLIHTATYRDAGYCLIDWAGSLYQRVLNHLAYFTPSRPIYLLNPADPEMVTRYNPFNHPGSDVGTTVNRRIALTVRPWGSGSTNQTPTLERVARILYHFAIASNQPLPNAALLLDYNHRQQLFDYALRVLDTFEHQPARRKLQELGELKTFNQWRDQVGSTDNRILRFTASGPLRRAIGFQTGNIDVRRIVDENAILLVNLAPIDPMDEDSARVFAALLLNDFFNVARARPNTEERFFLVLDEFQEYMSLDLASMLDTVRKGGLRLVMAHQHLGHLADDPMLRKSIFTNARVKVVFGGLDAEDATAMAHEIYMREINEREIVETMYKRESDGVDIHVLPTVSETQGLTQSTSRAVTRGQSFATSSSLSESSGASEAFSTNENWREYDGEEVGLSAGAGETALTSASSGSVKATGKSESTSLAESESDSTGRTQSRTVGMTYLTTPKYRETVAGYVERDRSDRIGLHAEKLAYQPERHCTIRVKGARPEQFVVPFVDDYEVSRSLIRPYERELFAASDALPIDAADELLVKSQREFLDGVRQQTRPKQKHFSASKPPKI